MREEFVNEDFCTVVFDEFFFSLLSSDNIVRHLLRLLWFVHTKITQTR
jgi:negative elongation factor B